MSEGNTTHRSAARGSSDYAPTVAAQDREHERPSVHGSRGPANKQISGFRWYAVHTRVGQEKVAEQNLLAQDYRIYLPSRSVTVRHARKLLHKNAAFFPGYLFVRLNPQTDRWRPINGTRGVRSLVMSGEAPLPVPTGIVEGLMSLTTPSGELKARIEFCEGQKVRICSGPLSGYEGEIERIAAKERVKVLLAIMSSEISVELRPDHLVPTGGR